MGNDSMDLGLKNIWDSWFTFKKGKNFTADLHDFQYHLEKNLYELFRDLNSGNYRHGGYDKFIVCDNKRREISVAGIRDRVVHRLMYDFLNKIYDKTFIFDAWSCRLNKGLLGAIERVQTFLRRYPHGHIWKGDVRKFFDSIDQKILLEILSSKIKDLATIQLLKEVIGSFSAVKGRKIGMPIGNLTSQIFANIYLNELDRFVKNRLKPKAYLRYGDDFIIVESDPKKLNIFRTEVAKFLETKLKLRINPKSDKVIKANNGLKFLGIKFWPTGRTLNNRSLMRTTEKLAPNNTSSYNGLIAKHGSRKRVKRFSWIIYGKLLADL